MIREIVAEGEAGVGDVIAIYEAAEAFYFGASAVASAAIPVATYATDTSPA